MTTTAIPRGRLRERPWHGFLTLASAVAVLVAAACGDDGGGDGAADLVLGAPPDCEENPFCIPGLQDVYDVDLSGGFVPLTTEVVAESLRSGEIDIGVLFATDAVLADDDLVAIEDDRGMFAADNILPVGSRSLADAYGDDLAAGLDAVSAELTTDSLIQMNALYGNENEDADAIAADWLADTGLAEESGSEQDGPTVSIGAQEFGESIILAEVYKQALEANGFQARVQNVGGNRNLLFGAFESGDVNLAPEYLASELNFLAEENVATSDVEESLSELEPLLSDRDMVAFEPSPAANPNVFVMTRERADELGVSKLSDLSDVG